MYVQDDSPSAETRYRSRFRFDPNSITMTSGNAHHLFYGYAGTSTLVLRLEFRCNGGGCPSGGGSGERTWRGSSRHGALATRRSRLRAARPGR